MKQRIIGRFRRSDGSVGRFNIESVAAEEWAEASERPDQVFGDLPPESAVPDGSPYPEDPGRAAPR